MGPSAGATGEAAGAGTAASGGAGCAPTAAQYLQYELPDEVLLAIFSYLMEQDLCRLALVCKRFNTIANDTELWKRLYQSVFEYDLPLFNPELCKFVFEKPEESEYANPWKESFRQLYRGVHVRPGYQERRSSGRSIVFFNTIQAALDYPEERAAAGVFVPAGAGAGNVVSAGLSNTSASAGVGGASVNALVNIYEEQVAPTEHPGPLIFLHAGHYKGEYLFIDSDVALVGAAPGNVAESVILEREAGSTVMFVEGPSTPTWVTSHSSFRLKLHQQYRITSTTAWTSARTVLQLWTIASFALPRWWVLPSVWAGSTPIPSFETAISATAKM